MVCRREPIWAAGDQGFYLKAKQNPQTAASILGASRHTRTFHRENAAPPVRFPCFTAAAALHMGFAEDRPERRRRKAKSGIGLGTRSPIDERAAAGGERTKGLF